MFQIESRCLGVLFQGGGGAGFMDHQWVRKVVSGDNCCEEVEESGVGGAPVEGRSPRPLTPTILAAAGTAGRGAGRPAAAPGALQAARDQGPGGAAAGGAGLAAGAAADAAAG